MCSFMGTKLAEKMIKVLDYIDGDKFESICDFSFGDYYTSMINLDLSIPVTDKIRFKFDNVITPMITTHSFAITFDF